MVWARVVLHAINSPKGSRTLLYDEKTWLSSVIANKDSIGPVQTRYLVTRLRCYFCNVVLCRDAPTLGKFVRDRCALNRVGIVKDSAPWKSVYREARRKAELLTIARCVCLKSWQSLHVLEMAHCSGDGVLDGGSWVLKYFRW